MEIEFLVYYLPIKYCENISRERERDLLWNYFQCDLIKDDTTINTERLDNYCRENGFAKWFETSAQENINIEVAIQYLIGLV